MTGSKLGAGLVLLCVSTATSLFSNGDLLTGLMEKVLS